MDKKIMLMDMIKELNKVWEAFYLLEADAEAYLEEVKKEYEECIYDLVFAYVNKDEEMPHKFESQALIDAIKLSVKAKEFLDNDYLVQKYAIGEK